MKKALLLLIAISATVNALAQTTAKQQINQTLDAWHKAAADANYTNYFNTLTDDSIFIGTDAAENWNKTAFQAFAKPYFDKGKAWNFTALERNIFFNEDKTLAWFDELLSTQMKLCRGSGILAKVGKEWKIKHYVLSMTIPNDNSDEVVKIKTPIEDAFLSQMKAKR